MAYARPKLTDLQSQATNDIEAAQPGADALLRFSPLRIMGRVAAGFAHQHYGYLDYIAKQAVPWTSSDEYLVGWGALKKVWQKAATKAGSPAVQFPGANNVALDIGVALVRGDGVQYVTTSAGNTGTAGTLSVTVEAVEAGAAGNFDTGTKLSLAQAIEGLQSTGTAVQPAIGGADVEAQDDFSDRVMAAYQSSPQGGAVDDYPGWATAQGGVTRAWCNPMGFGAGTVVLYFMMDEVEQAHQGFPQGSDGVATAEKRSGVKATGDQLLVANALYPLRPATALLYVCAPLPHTLNFTVSGLSGATEATRKAIKAAFSDVLLRNGSPLQGTIDRTDIEGGLSSIAAAAGGVIDQVAGVIGEVTTVFPGNVASPLGYLPTLGTVSFT
ncbi:MAG: hypothetical protein GAK35_03547 [Herbaspirillum frisingense]|uniref:Baseplate J/gp47 family protein n=1 Tax=Herbaspirillum frisingense TaxID=92645 RepID=A0A7V8FU42_9BURK|nr:MAG: hypothetical protein GAK35_03547 [Herbaspirillum frisingense]